MKLADVRHIETNLGPGAACDVIVDGKPCRAFAGSTVAFEFGGSIRLRFAVCPQHWQRVNPHTTQLKFPERDALRVFEHWRATPAGQTFLVRMEQLESGRS